MSVVWLGGGKGWCYSLICDDGFAVAAFNGEGLFARVGVWCL